MDDTDIFSVSLQAGYTYRFDLEGQDTGAGTLFDPAFYIGDSSGTVLVFDDDSGTGLNARINDFTPATSGTYFLYAYVDDRDLTGTYRIGATQTASPTPTTPTVISLQAVDFAIDEGDTFDFQMTRSGPSDREVVVSYTIVPGVGATQADFGGFATFGGSARFLENGSNTISVSQVIFDDMLAEGIETFSIEIGSIFALPPSGGGIGILSTSDPVLETGLSTINGQINASDPVIVDISASDPMISEGEPIIFEIGRSGGTGSAFTVSYSIGGDPGGFSSADLASPSDLSGSVSFTANGPDSFTISIPTFNDTITESAEEFRAFLNQISGVQPYGASVTTAGTASITGEIAASDPNPTTPTTPTTPNDDYPIAFPGQLAIGGSLTGNIEQNGDTDQFAVTLVAGNTYQFDMRGVDTGAGSLGNPFLQLGDSIGTFLGSGTDLGTGLDDRITFTPDTSGSYFLNARVLGDNGTGTYQISAAQTGTTPTNPAADVPEIVQKVARLYEAALDRDGQYLAFDGFNFWIDKAEGGADFRVLSAAFLNSPEFRTNFGDAFDQDAGSYLTNVAFVDALYQSVLGRDGGPGMGRQFWIDKLEIGNGNRSAILRDFAESPENVANTLPLINTISEASDGYWVFG